jgi:predicted nucleic acid-binding protein
MDQSRDAIEILRAWRRQRAVLTSPALLAFEVTSVLRNHTFRNAISAESANAALSAFRRLPVRYASHSALIPRAWALASRLDRPTAYDAFYLALAESLGCTFWTADKRLYSSAHEALSWIHLLGESADESATKR